ncbi:chitin synthase III catalytic subunit [Catenaria anguillulae PL171]|uniref:Chitin synthase III catalytic subunit n=1 Tax=Catenaria anguillulae PL171 TaxID=765915 RepID=A0A1Y2HJG5_9FUNG|nr:chitin synthase III catalytic subunit [Catenaria anguillulae PL171]
MVNFGVFDDICAQVAYPLCPLVGQGVEPTCYSRNIEVAGKLLFQPATLVVYIIALIMTLIMIYHIKSKYTAVGRKEIVMFFYLYLILVIVEFVLVSNIVPSATPPYPYLAAVHMGLLTASFWVLLLNGFVGFQWTEDGTPLSLWTIRLSGALLFTATFFIALATFNSWAPFDSKSPTVLFLVFFVFNLAMLAIYLVLQVILVVNTLDNRWPLGDLFFGVLFFATGQVFVHLFSTSLCTTAKHYIDGLFFGATFSLLAVMMVYKYWDSITKDDLEFAIPTNKMMGMASDRDPLMMGEPHEQYS